MEETKERRHQRRARVSVFRRRLYNMSVYQVEESANVLKPASRDIMYIVRAHIICRREEKFRTRKDIDVR